MEDINKEIIKKAMIADINQATEQALINGTTPEELQRIIINIMNSYNNE